MLEVEVTRVKVDGVEKSSVERDEYECVAHVMLSDEASCSISVGIHRTLDLEVRDA